MTQGKTPIALREEETQKFWEENDIFNKSVHRDAPNGDFVFYDGPPFATGTSHYGHLVASAIKDAVPRYWTMRGYKVERQWGWDCHGLPLENIVEKELSISGREDILKLGVKKFNDVCRDKIAQVSDEWGKLIPRFGRWADMEHPYRTMDTTFMESEWWVFKTLYDKGLAYEDYRSIHICPRCETTLSQSEVTEGYKDIKDISVTVEFPVKGEPDTVFLAWTTTPWTLPGNVALAIHNDVVYAEIQSTKSEIINENAKLKPGMKYVVAKERIGDVVGEESYEIVKEMKGNELVGTEYTPPFDSYAGANIENIENAWKVYAADFITTDTGTGIAHEAPAFGAEDLDLARELSLPIIQHVSMNGVIKPEVTELAGLHVKPKDDHQATDVEVIKYLAGKGVLFSKEKVEHSYPHCWRCDTPLLNYATTSWFIAVEKMKPELLTHAEGINWSPAHIKKGRWGNWLEGARDWSISRQRFWANTMPVWRCDACTNEVVFGSIAELKEASGVEVTDLHKDVVDEVAYDCDCGGTMRRIPDVLDTWFNSGSVPFASYHYPFENQGKVEARIPADFIAEGTDQTRAWFYYQHVLVGGAFGKPAFKNVIVNGMVMAEDGKKMAKKLKNYPDPKLMIDTYGADAVRLYLLSSPVVRAEDFNFTERDAANVSNKVMGRLENVYSFYALYKDFVEHEAHANSTNVLDRWIVELVHTLHREVTNAMDAYELDRATRPLGDFVDALSRWYLRRSRNRMKSGEAADALSTLRYVLREYARISAPFTPFIAEWLWERVKNADAEESVHLTSWGVVHDKVKNNELLSEMKEAQYIVAQALDERATQKINVRQPLALLTFNSFHDFSQELLNIIADEINVKHAIRETESSLEIGDVELDTAITPELQAEGDMREVVRAIQGARKDNDFALTDAGEVTLRGPQDVLDATAQYQADIESQTHTTITLAGVHDELQVTIAKK